LPKDAIHDEIKARTGKPVSFQSSSCRRTPSPWSLQDDPFALLDEMGVGKLMELAVQWGRSVKSDRLVGFCGERGGYPVAIAFCDRIKLDR
jgi:phosphoenolpyruvate synthase/pyruvate phosphate dikinase